MNKCKIDKMKNTFLAGAPSSGKTTVIKKIIKNLDFPANRFYTEEEKVAGKRAGFLMKAIDGKRGHLVHQDLILRKVSNLLDTE